MEMGKEIRRLRQDRGLTQEALAAALNVTAQTVSKWECGNSIPDVQLLPEIAVYFGVSIDQLFAMTPAQQMERIENRIYARGLFDEAEERQLEQQLGAFAEDPALKGQAELLLTKLYNNQAEQYRLLAVEHGKVAVEETKGDSDAVSELTNAWGSYISDWNVRNHHALIAWLSDYCERNPRNRCPLMWLLDNLIDDRRLAEAKQWLEKLAALDDTFRVPMYRYLIAQAEGKGETEQRLRELEERLGLLSRYRRLTEGLGTCLEEVRAIPGEKARRAAVPSTIISRSIRMATELLRILHFRPSVSNRFHAV